MIDWLGEGLADDDGSETVDDVLDGELLTGGVDGELLTGGVAGTNDQNACSGNAP